MTKTAYSVVDFLDWQRQGSLELRPSYQRRSVWSPRVKSLLIDSMLRGYPIPLVFLNTRLEAGTGRAIRQVVDGQQRLRTILSFIDLHSVRDSDDWDDFTLLGSHRPDLAGARFVDLGPDLQNRLLQTAISVNVLPSDIDDVTVLRIFQRMNSTGLKLTEQEIRNGTFFGEFMDACLLAYEQNPRWIDWGLFTRQQIAQMSEVEFVSDLMGLLLHGVSGRSRMHLDALYRSNDEAFPERDSIQTGVRRLFDVLGPILDDRHLPKRFRSAPWVYAMAALVWRVPTTVSRPGDRVEVGSTELARILSRAEQVLTDRSLSRSLPESLRRQTTRRSSREERIDFLRAL